MGAADAAHLHPHQDGVLLHLGLREVVNLQPPDIFKNRGLDHIHQVESMGTSARKHFPINLNRAIDLI